MWLEEKQEDRFRICIREVKTFDGKHQNIQVVSQLWLCYTSVGLFFNCFNLRKTTVKHNAYIRQVKRTIDRILTNLSIVFQLALSKDIPVFRVQSSRIMLGSSLAEGTRGDSTSESVNHKLEQGEKIIHRKFSQLQSTVSLVQINCFSVDTLSGLGRVHTNANSTYLPRKDPV